MALNRINAITVSLLVQITVTFVRSAPVSMYVRQEATSDNYVYLDFHNGMFQKLYDCMTDVYTTQCDVKAKMQSSGTLYTEERVEATDIASIRISHSVPGYFTCFYDRVSKELQCTRNNTVECAKNVCSSFRLSSSSTCACVYLLWKYPGERLVFDDDSDNIVDCKLGCLETTASPSMVTTTLSPQDPSLDAKNSDANKARSLPRPMKPAFEPDFLAKSDPRKSRRPDFESYLKSVIPPRHRRLDFESDFVPVIILLSRRQGYGSDLLPDFNHIRHRRASFLPRFIPPRPPVIRAPPRPPAVPAPPRPPAVPAPPRPPAVPAPPRPPAVPAPPRPAVIPGAPRPPFIPAPPRPPFIPAPPRPPFIPAPPRPPFIPAPPRPPFIPAPPRPPFIPAPPKPPVVPGPPRPPVVPAPPRQPFIPAPPRPPFIPAAPKPPFIPAPPNLPVVPEPPRPPVVPAIPNWPNYNSTQPN